MKTALTIAGSDCSGGAGIQADIKTMTANGVYAMSAITALTAQNTTGVSDIMEVTPVFLQEQLDAVFTDIFPDAVKIGMVSSSALIYTIAQALRTYCPHNIVVDPVMVATSGSRLISEDAIATLKEELFPLADVITPNIPEAEILSGLKICSAQDMQNAAAKSGCNTTVPYFVKAVIPSMMQMICCIPKEHSIGFMENEFPTPIRMAPVVPFPARLPPIWLKIIH